MKKRKWETFSEEELKNFYNQSESCCEFLHKLGYLYGSHPKKIFSQIQERYSWAKDFSKITPWNKKNIAKRRFGKLVAIEDTGKTYKGHALWLCKCDCGKIIEVTVNKLESGNTKSCGCIQKEFAATLGHSHADDLSGKVFGYLKVLYDSGERQSGNIKWICKCLKCGKITHPITASSIKRGITKSCGCLQESYYESVITDILEELNIVFKKQFIFSDLKGDSDNLRFDFALFKNEDLVCLIEYQGEQHYKPVEFFGGEEQFKKTLRYDSLKEEYCKNNNIKLIKIPYWDNVNKEYVINFLKKECCECLQMK